MVAIIFMMGTKYARNVLFVTNYIWLQSRPIGTKYDSNVGLNLDSRDDVF